MYDKQPFVSIRLMTYNHGKYITEALNGIFIQKTNFNIEVIVGDDLSDDSTLEIIKRFQNSETITIKILDRVNDIGYSKNRKEKGRLYNFVNILSHCCGKYIALLDGDDYWSDEYKLQKQVDYLESDPNCMISGHLINIFKNGEILPLEQNGDIFYLQHEMIQENYLRTVSVVFRNNIINIPRSVYKYPIADWFVYMLLLEHGYAYVSDERMAVYRMHDTGIWSNMNENERIKKTLDIYSLFLEDFPHLKPQIDYYMEQQRIILKDVNSANNLFNRVKTKIMKLVN